MLFWTMKQTTQQILTQPNPTHHIIFSKLCVCFDNGLIKSECFGLIELLQMFCCNNSFVYNDLNVYCTNVNKCGKAQIRKRRVRSVKCFWGGSRMCVPRARQSWSGKVRLCMVRWLTMCLAWGEEGKTGCVVSEGKGCVVTE